MAGDDIGLYFFLSLYYFIFHVFHAGHYCCAIRCYANQFVPWNLFLTQHIQNFTWDRFSRVLMAKKDVFASTLAETFRQISNK